MGKLKLRQANLKISSNYINKNRNNNYNKYHPSNRFFNKNKILFNNKNQLLLTSMS